MNADQLLEQYAADLRDFSGLDLSGVNLPGVNLSRSVFTQTNFKAAKLTNSDFSDSSCEQAQFHGANLTLSDFSHAQLQNADLSNAELTRADFSAADLRSANLSHSDLRDAKLRCSNLNQANLSRADLRYAKLVSANLQQVNLTSSDLSSTDLSGADLRYAELRQATLNRANLQGANLRGANLRWADLTGAKLSGANLTGVDLSHAILLDATLVHVDLSRSNLAFVDWTGADLSGSTLTGAKLHAVSPFGIKTAGAICRWIDLSQNGDQSQIYQFTTDDLSEYFHEFPPVVEIVIDDRLSSDAHCALAVAYQQLARQKSSIVPPQIEIHKRRTVLRFALDRDEDLFSTAFIAILPFADAQMTQKNLLEILKLIPTQSIEASELSLHAFQALIATLGDSIQKIDASKLIQAIPIAIQKIRFFQAPTRLTLSNSTQRSLTIYDSPQFGKRRIRHNPTEEQFAFLNQPIEFVLPSQSEAIEFLHAFQLPRS